MTSPSTGEIFGYLKLFGAFHPMAPGLAGAEKGNVWAAEVETGTWILVGVPFDPKTCQINWKVT